MKIKKILDRNRRDLQCLYVCEDCGAEHEAYGYDDSYFHNEVVPKMACKECGHVGSDTVMEPRYPEGMAV